MNLVDLLLSTDVESVIKRETKELEIKRLSKELGEPFIITIKEIEPEKLIHLQTASTKMSKKGELNNVDVFKLQMLTLAAGIEDPDFNNKELLKKYGCGTPADLFSKIFKTGEIAFIVNEINNLSVKEDMVVEVKN